METIKTIGVLAVLVVVGYLGYKAVTNPPATPPNEAVVQDGSSSPDGTSLNIPIPELPPGVQPPDTAVMAGNSPSSSAPSQVAQQTTTAFAPPPAAINASVPSSGIPPSSTNLFAPPNSADVLANQGGAGSQSGSPLDVLPAQPAVGSPANVAPEQTAEGAPKATEILSSLGRDRTPAVIASPDAVQPTNLDRGSLATQSLPGQGGSSAIAASAAGETPRGVRKEFAEFLAVAYQKLDRGDFARVHPVLSAWYADPRLTPEEDAQLSELLDQVAGTVVYSRQSFLEPYYVVQAGDALPQIAERFNVPWELLAKINGITQADQLPPGMQLKVIRGPFEAVVHLRRQELVLMVQGCYAGRFRIGIGRDAQGAQGVYQVREKTLQPRYYTDSGVIEAGDPRNPLGAKWIGLGGRLGIHAAQDPSQFANPQAPGAIFLSPKDMDDVFDILSVGSRVEIRP